jgi:hypothetical protein
MAFLAWTTLLIFAWILLAFSDLRSLYTFYFV